MRYLLEIIKGLQFAVPLLFVAQPQGGLVFYKRALMAADSAS